MRVEQLLPATVRRLRRPGLWAGAVGLGLLWALVRLNLRVPFGRYGAMEAWLPGLLLVLTLLFAPLPWQWTGDDRPLAPAWRGLLQSFLFDAVWVGLLLGALAPAAARRPRPLPPPPEFEAAPPRSQPPPPPLSLDLFHGSLGLLLALGAGRVLAEREAEAQRAQAADALAAQARLQALQAQLHPHALFNALSGLTELVHEDPEAAEAALVTLTDFLRRLMRQGAQASTLLKEERSLLELQLRLAELRLGPRLEVDWQWPAWADGWSAPPLLLQPLVENALRHGIATRTMGGRVRLSASRQAGALVLEVANTGTLVEPSKEGMGLRNLRERLALLDPPGRLELVQEDRWTVARVRLGGTA